MEKIYCSNCVYTPELIYDEGSLKCPSCGNTIQFSISHITISNNKAKNLKNSKKNKK